MELPGQLLRAASLVLVLGLLAALVLGSWRADADVHQEMESALSVAQLIGRATASADQDDDQLLLELRTLMHGPGVRHLRISLRDANGSLRLATREHDPAPLWLDALVRALRRWQPETDPAPFVVDLPRSSGVVWSLVVTPNPDSERRESLLMLAQTSAVLGVSALLLLLLLRWQIQRALSPMRDLLHAIDHLRQGHTDSARELPPMPVSELQAVSSALQGLGQSLERAERDRRILSLRLQSLQEDERRRMAQELHDELGQRLTALRLEASVLRRRLEHEPDLQASAARLADQVQDAQQEVSDLVHRLSPRFDHGLPVQRLCELLQALPAASRSSSDTDPVLRLHVDLRPGAGELSEALMMALYRMSQEALTNAQRHSRAQQARLQLHHRGPVWHWSFEDDGQGLGDALQAQHRGNGLAGMRERAWAFGGDLQIDSAPGRLRLSATLTDPLHTGGETQPVQPGHESA